MKTTSIFQVFDVTSFAANAPLIVRPPQNLRAFRVTIFPSSQTDNTQPAEIQISNDYFTNDFQGIVLSNSFSSATTTVAVPGTDLTSGFYYNNFTLILDRRGVGYMADTFYCAGKGSICFIWEGEVE
jgi:hypothetical protein